MRRGGGRVGFRCSMQSSRPPRSHGQTRISESSCCSLRSRVFGLSRIPAFDTRTSTRSLQGFRSMTLGESMKAIRIANPGGLGNVPEQDVRNEPTVTLLEAMKLAADRDLIARQYANGFADVFDFGVPAFLARSSSSAASRPRSSSRNSGGSPSTRTASSPARTARPSPRTSAVAPWRCCNSAGSPRPKAGGPASHSTGTCVPTATNSTPGRRPT